VAGIRNPFQKKRYLIDLYFFAALREAHFFQAAFILLLISSA
jgi:hypothetical protein